MSLISRVEPLVRSLREKHFDKWLPGYLRHLARMAAAPRTVGPKHLLFALCDHYEPLWGQASDEAGRARVDFWEEHYPRMARRFVDADGHHPRHSFFFPGEQYREEYLEALARLARAGFGEVEVHLHHDGDTSATLRAQLTATLADFARHGHLARDPDGRLRYGFIHGNWALANPHPSGWGCGVDDELVVLWETGCYADFTFPSVPDFSQPNIVNRIYWPVGDLRRKRAYEQGEPARVGQVRRDRLLMIEGPLALARRPGLLRGRIENSGIQASDHPTLDRVRTWAAQGIHVEGRPEWVFVKTYTHGAPDEQGAALLGPAGDTLHRALAEFCATEGFVLHYVTAREMWNIAMAAMSGERGDPGRHRDHVLPPPPLRAEGSPARPAVAPGA